METHGARVTPAREHECGACGGTGGSVIDGGVLRVARKEHFCGGQHNGDRRVHCATKIPKGAVYVEWMDSAAAYQSGVRYHWHCGVSEAIVRLCPVCLGAGRISDVRTARDAMADAETLRIIAYDQPIETGDFGALRCAIDLRALPWFGHHYHGDERILADDATWSARAAFRAVPALRGEE